MARSPDLHRAQEYGDPALGRTTLPWDGTLTIACNISNNGSRAVEESCMDGGSSWLARIAGEFPKTVSMEYGRLASDGIPCEFLTTLSPEQHGPLPGSQEFLKAGPARGPQGMTHFQGIRNWTPSDLARPTISNKLFGSTLRRNFQRTCEDSHSPF